MKQIEVAIAFQCERKSETQKKKECIRGHRDIK